MWRQAHQGLRWLLGVFGSRSIAAPPANIATQVFTYRIQCCLLLVSANMFAWEHTQQPIEVKQIQVTVHSRKHTRCRLEHEKQNLPGCVWQWTPYNDPAFTSLDTAEYSI